MADPRTEFTTNSDGLAIAYQTVGEGPIDIVFLPLFGCIDQMWDDPEYGFFLDRLCTVGRLITLDVRGVGASDPVPLGGLPTPEKWMDDLRVVLDAAESDRASVIAAGTFGIMTMFFAATYPERVGSLVLIDSFARWLRADDYPVGGTPEGIDMLVQLFRQTWGTGLSTASSNPSRRHDQVFQRWVARTERLTATPVQVAAYWAWGLQLDVRDVLPVIKAPTLVIHNHPNNIAHLDHSQYLAENIPDARLVQIERGESYLFSREDGDRLLDHIEEFLTGASPTPRPATSLVTLLFTDVVGSTEHAARLGDHAWRDVILRHDRLLASEVQLHNGKKVSSSGDGWLVTFDGPERAIRCGLRICEGVRHLGLEVRAAVHAGEVQRAGRDIHGLAVHIGARVLNLAGPGEVAVSSTVKELVSGADLRFDDRGLHDLKGVPTPWRIYDVTDPAR